MAFAAGSIGTSMPVRIMSTLAPMAFGCQLPVKSGFPSAVRGVGPGGGQLGSPPRPPRPWANAMFEVSRIAATAATARVTRLKVSCMQERLSRLHAGLKACTTSALSTKPSALWFRALSAGTAVVLVADHLVETGLFPLGMLLELPVLG